MTDALLRVNDLTKDFNSGFARHRQVRALDGVSLELSRGHVLGIVGESGSGKSTLARCVLRLIEPTAGQVHFGGQDVLAAGGRELRKLRRRMQIVFQDPYTSLDPRMTVEATVGEGLVVHGLIRDSRRRRARVVELLELVGLGAEHLARHPQAFSGGQRQRIGIARAIAVEPELLICDEPVSSLDVSIQAQVLNLFADLKRQLGLTILFIAHDLGVVRYLCDQVAVMHAGSIVEAGDREQIYQHPVHPYTRDLLLATPLPDPDREVERRSRLRSGVTIPLTAN